MINSGSQNNNYNYDKNGKDTTNKSRNQTINPTTTNNMDEQNFNIITRHLHEISSKHQNPKE